MKFTTILASIVGGAVAMPAWSSIQQAAQAGTDKASQFGLMTVKSGTDVHLQPVNVDATGQLTIGPADKFAARLVVGPNLIVEAENKDRYLIIDKQHNLRFTEVQDLANTTQDWTTMDNLKWNDEQFGMVCPNKTIIWGNEDFACDNGIGVELKVISMAV